MAARLSLNDVSLRFGGIKVLEEVTFDVEPGAIFGLVGPNGAGKTSLFNCISGHYKPTRQHLHAMMTIISNEGINLAAVTVVVRQPAIPGFIDEHTLNAANFVANVNLVDPNPNRVPA